jgi:hypothetical protein
MRHLAFRRGNRLEEGPAELAHGGLLPGRRPQIDYLTIRYMVTPSPLGQTMRLTGLTYLVVEGTMTRPHASGRVAKKAPLQTNPLQTPAPTLAKTK